MADIPGDVEVHVLPSGAPETPSVSLRYGKTSRLKERADQAYAASTTYLTSLTSP